jgi:hypothetical protein
VKWKQPEGRVVNGSAWRAAHTYTGAKPPPERKEVAAPRIYATARSSTRGFLGKSPLSFLLRDDRRGRLDADHLARREVGPARSRGPSPCARRSSQPLLMGLERAPRRPGGGEGSRGRDERSAGSGESMTEREDRGRASEDRVAGDTESVAPSRERLNGNGDRVAANGDRGAASGDRGPGSAPGRRDREDRCRGARRACLGNRPRSTDRAPGVAGVCGGRLEMFVGRTWEETASAGPGFESPGARASRLGERGEVTGAVPAALGARRVGRGPWPGLPGANAAKLSLESLEARRVRREDRPASPEARPLIFEARRRVRADVRTFQRARTVSPSARRRGRAARTGRIAARTTALAAQRGAQASRVATVVVVRKRLHAFNDRIEPSRANQLGSIGQSRGDEGRVRHGRCEKHPLAPVAAKKHRLEVERDLAICSGVCAHHDAVRAVVVFDDFEALDLDLRNLEACPGCERGADDEFARVEADARHEGDFARGEEEKEETCDEPDLVQRRARPHGHDQSKDVSGTQCEVPDGPEDAEVTAADARAKARCERPILLPA